MKEICVCVPCFNEEQNIGPMVECLQKIFQKELSGYLCRIMFIDNKSTDHTREAIRTQCRKYQNVQAIFNVRNFKYESGYYGLLEAGGDCTISIPADFQVPVEIIPKLVHEWEKGAAIVCAVKEGSKESILMWKFRQLFYNIYKKLSGGISIIRNFTGSGLYDRQFIKMLKELNDPLPSLMQVIATHGWNIKEITYMENKRQSGKTKSSFVDLINVAVLRITNVSTVIPKIITFFGVFIALCSMLLTFFYIILKLLLGTGFSSGLLPILLGVFFMGSVQLIFLGMLGEYIMKINIRLMSRPLVIEEERINFKENKGDDYEQQRRFQIWE